MHYTAIDIYVNLKCNKEQQTIMHKFDNGVRHNFAYVSGPFLCEGGFLIYFRKLIITSLQFPICLLD